MVGLQELDVTKKKLQNAADLVEYSNLDHGRAKTLLKADLNYNKTMVSQIKF